MFGISRQSIYQKEKRFSFRQKELEQVKQEVIKLRMEMPRIGGRKLYYLLEETFNSRFIKIGRDAFFDFLRKE